jgi:hypothetical protein
MNANNSLNAANCHPIKQHLGFVSSLFALLNVLMWSSKAYTIILKTTVGNM